MSAMAAALQNNSPMLVLGGRAPAMRWGQGSLQEIDHVPFVAPVTKSARTAQSTDVIPGLIDVAVAEAMTAPTGPTFVDFPLDHVFTEGAEPGVDLLGFEDALFRDVRIDVAAAEEDLHSRQVDLYIVPGRPRRADQPAAEGEQGAVLSRVPDAELRGEAGALRESADHDSPFRDAVRQAVLHESFDDRQAGIDAWLVLLAR
jgi:hypothetical protein